MTDAIYHEIDVLISSCATVIRNQDLQLDAQYLWTKLDEIEVSVKREIALAYDRGYADGYDAGLLD